MIPKGYKHTELGVLPEDWEVVRLGEIAEIRKDKFNPQKNKKVPCVELEHISQNLGILLGFIDSSNQLSIKNAFSKGDILFGKLRPYLRKFWKATFDGVCSSEIWVLQGKKVLNDFLFYLVQTDRFFQIANATCGTKMPRADWGLMKDEVFFIPPLAEQEKIAEILNTWDTQIQNYESLIAEKQNLKKGLCQTLLTAKTRLKGFSGDWEVVRLGDILEYEQPTKYLVSNTEYDNSYTTPVLTAGKTFILGYTDEVEGIYTNLPIILFDDFTTASQYVDFPFKVKSSACKILKLKKTEFSLRVVFEVMQRLNFVADDHKRYWISEYQNQEIFLPNAKEQRGIAKILSEADNEITLLEQKLESLKSQKKGLMQNLLNGKVRVKI